MLRFVCAAQLGRYAHMYIAFVKFKMEKNMKKIVFGGIIFTTLFVSSLSASCRCACIEGEVRAVCSSSLDIEPICVLRICPITSPSIAPIQTPRVPPIGTSNCIQKQIYNENTGMYEWQEVCY